MQNVLNGFRFAILLSGMILLLSAQESERKKIGQDGFIGKWRVMVVKELPFTDQRLNGKIPKVGSANIGPEFY